MDKKTGRWVFAWTPRKLDSGRWVWLRWVWRYRQKATRPDSEKIRITDSGS